MEEEFYWMKLLLLIYNLFLIANNNVVVAVPDNTCQNERPHIIFIMADDAGWNDFSFHGSVQIPTPNIDALGFNGIILNSYYGSPLCTPTRGAIMTGKHPIHLRLQHYVVMGQTVDGLPLEEKLLPQFLKELGYTNHLVGKWHLGHARQAFTPTQRGFDTHFGYWLGKQDYYDHFSLDGSKIGWGYDFRSNLSVNYDVFGKYDTDLFTEEAIRILESHPKNNSLFLMINHIAPHSGNSYKPLQAPKEYVDKFKFTIEDENRRIYAALVDKLDESVGLIVQTLESTGLLENSIIVFVSDNGGAPQGYDLNFGSNWPLRGVKNTLWEGGTRLAGLIWSPKIQNRVSYDVFHAKDWLPTLWEAAGGLAEELGNIDGKSLWKTFTEGEQSPVTEFLYNIDDIYNNSAIRYLNWKLIQGNTSTNDLGGGIWDFWYGPSGREKGKSVQELIPIILDSYTGMAMKKAGFPLNELEIQKLQVVAEIVCGIEQDQEIECNPYQGPCLFDLIQDPCEKRNVAGLNPLVVQNLLMLLDAQNKTSLEPIPRFKDPEGLPSKWGYVWTNWKDFLDPQNI